MTVQAHFQVLYLIPIIRDLDWGVTNLFLKGFGAWLFLFLAVGTASKIECNLLCETFSVDERGCGVFSSEVVFHGFVNSVQFVPKTGVFITVQAHFQVL